MQAPGYFQVVQRGMDFTTMRSKVQGESYSAWQEFQVNLAQTSLANGCWDKIVVSSPYVSLATIA